MDLIEYEKLDPFISVDSPQGPVQFSTPNRVAAWRVETLFSKEPDTIDWIASFAPGSVLFDIGANVGMYTIWAAKTRGARVFAFEPESQNFALLYRNIIRNGVADLVVGYCASLSDRCGFGHLRLSEFVTGSSVHQFSDVSESRQKSGGYCQGSYSSTLDTLVGEGVLPVPDYVKIDVDGIEPRIVRGARATLADPKVKSVVIEIDTNVEDHWNVVDVMLDLGFDYAHEQVERARRKEGLFKGVGNYVFRR